ncbi:MAG: SPASM domain-containing protein [Lachnospiraceae bacterium]|nr:SPASM domain-containing protein [Lachnospiraceae bacterium]
MNIHKNTLLSIWNGKERERKIRKNLLGIMDAEMRLCENCNVKNDFAYNEDYLDPYVEEILKKI